MSGGGQGQGGGFGGGQGGMGAPTPQYGQVPGGSDGMGGGAGEVRTADFQSSPIPGVDARDVGNFGGGYGGGMGSGMGGFSGTMGGPGFGPGGLGTAGMGGYGGGMGDFGGSPFMGGGYGGGMPFVNSQYDAGDGTNSANLLTSDMGMNNPRPPIPFNPRFFGGYGGGMGGYGGMPFFGGYGGGMGGFSRGFGSPFRGGFGGMGGGFGGFQDKMGRPAVMPGNVAGNTYTTGMQPDISKNDLQTIQSIFGTDQANVMNRVANLSDADRQTLTGIEQRLNPSRFPVNIAGGVPSMSTPDQAPPQMMNRPAVIPQQPQAQPSRQRVPRLQDLQNRLRSAFGNDIVGKPVNAGWLPLIGTPRQPAELTSLYGIPPYRPSGQSATPQQPPPGQDVMPQSVPESQAKGPQVDSRLPANPQYPGLAAGVKPSDLKPGTYFTPDAPGPAPNPGNDPRYPLPNLPPATSAQGAYDRSLAQYNSPEYAAYYNSLAPSTRAYMNAPGDPARGQYLAEQARQNYIAYGGKDPWARGGMKAGGIISLLKRK